LRALAQHASLALAYAETFDALNFLNRELEARVAERTAQVVAQQRTLAVYEDHQRLARDLHDSITQTLFSVSLGMRHVRGLAQRDPAAATEALAEQEAAVRGALSEMRGLLAQLRGPLPADDAPTDLAQALRGHCAGLAQPAGLTVALDAPPALLLPASLAGEVLSMAREALHNIVKHAGVADATCALAVQGDWLTLTVQDAGRGFDPAAPADGLGLAGMKERAAALGGTVEVASAPEQGTQVQVRLPLRHRGDDDQNPDRG
jgi:signal transduction histidine kinase